MAVPDELLAKAREAADAWIAAASDSAEEWDAADQLVANFRALDEHMKTTGEPPADWTPLVPGWDLVLTCPDPVTAARAQTEMRNQYGWVCAVRVCGDWIEVVVSFGIRQNAEIALGHLRNDLGWLGQLRHTRNRTSEGARN